MRQQPLQGDRTLPAVSALEAIQRKIHEMAGQLGVPLSQTLPDPQRKLAALAGHWWTMALDCRADALRGYGEVDPETATFLDPMEKGLVAAFLSLETLVR